MRFQNAIERQLPLVFVTALSKLCEVELAVGSAFAVATFIFARGSQRTVLVERGG